MIAGLITLAGVAFLPRLPAEPRRPAVAVFPPWWTAEDTFQAAARAGVRIVGSNGLPGMILVAADTPETLFNLYQTGAWSVLSAGRWAGCRAGAQGDGVRS